MLLADVLKASDSLWGTGRVKSYSDEDLHILFGAAARIMLECGSEEGRRHNARCDSLRLLQNPSFLKQADEALSLLYLGDVPCLPSMVR